MNDHEKLVTEIQEILFRWLQQVPEPRLVEIIIAKVSESKNKEIKNTLEQAALRLEVASNIIEKELDADEDDVEESRAFIKLLRSMIKE